MFMGKVIGNVWSTVKSNRLDGYKLLLIRPYNLKDLSGSFLKRSHDGVIAVDTLGAGIGEEVIVAYGHAGRVAAENTPEGQKPMVPIDAAVVAIVDKYSLIPGLKE